MSAWKHLISKTGVFGCSENSDSGYAILGIPLDQATTYKPGTRFAPQSIRNAACNIEFYSMYTDMDIERIGFYDLGDIVVSPGDLVESFKRISYVVGHVIREYSDKIIYFLGGEHSISYPILKSMIDEVDTIVVFDAHSDMRDEYLGSKYNHATVMRRIVEEFEKQLILIGVRAISSEEIEFIRRNESIVAYTSMDIVRGKIPNLPIRGNVYISIDMDVIDPSYAPGVDNPEPLGITPYNLLDILYRVINKANRVVALDLVEVNPLVDVNDITSILASKILIEATGILEKKRSR
ncbi:MAG: agmatinase [Thermoprotei archaeon]